MMLARYARNPVAFMDRFIKRTSTGQPFSVLPHWRAVLPLAFAFDPDGRLPFDTVVLSTNKKGAKTEMNGAINTWWAYTQEAPNELPIVANDLEQSQGRVFKAVAGQIRNNPDLARSAEIGARTITLSNGTTITAIASEYAGAAGSNHGLTSWDELWAYTSESSRRLWEELTPVPTRRNSVTAAGIPSRDAWGLVAKMYPSLYAVHAGHPSMISKSAPTAESLLAELAAYFAEVQSGMRRVADDRAAALTAAERRDLVTALLNAASA